MVDTFDSGVGLQRPKRPEIPLFWWISLSITLFTATTLSVTLYLTLVNDPPSASSVPTLLSDGDGLWNEAEVDSSIHAGPEYTCMPNWNSVCTEEEVRAGPPPELTQPRRLSEADRILFRSVQSRRAEWEAAAQLVAVPKLAFLVLTRGPMPLEPLWERFLSGAHGLYSIYVHASAPPGLNGPATSSRLFGSALIRSEAVVWGTISLVDAERRLLATALADPTNRRFILVSESCAPLRPFSTVYHTLLNSALSQVECLRSDGPHNGQRYNPSMQPQVSSAQWCKGSQWWAITRAHAYAVVGDKAVYRKVEKYCRSDKWHHFCYPDEHYIQTLLSIVEGAGLSNRSVTFVDWSRQSWHPRTFHAEDIKEDRVGQWQGGGPEANSFLFFRKVDPTALQPLLALSSKAFGY